MRKQDGKALDSVACGIIKEVKEEEIRLQEVAKESVSNDIVFDDLKRRYALSCLSILSILPDSESTLSSIEKRFESIDGYSDDE